MIPRTPQLWFSIAQLSFMYSFHPDTIRKWLKDGKFGDLKDTRHVMDIDGDIRVSATACAFFELNHPMEYDAAIRARNAAELRRRMKKGASNA